MVAIGSNAVPNKGKSQWRCSTRVVVLILGLVVSFALLVRHEQQHSESLRVTKSIQSMERLAADGLVEIREAPAVNNIQGRIKLEEEDEAPNDDDDDDATVVKSSNKNGGKEIVDFEKQEGVVLAVKIHGGEIKKNQLIMLKQSLCLLNAAYNQRVHYDQVIFSTIPIPEEDAEELRRIVAPAKLSLYIDAPPFQEVVASFTEEQRGELVKKCKVNNISELDWLTKCEEPGHGVNSFAYTWQAEFRSKHIWQHPGLADYKYMLWMDADAMCSRAWENDPVAYMIRNDLVMLFDNFPQGWAKEPVIHDRIHQSFGKHVCDISLAEDGHLETKMQDEMPCEGNPLLGQIHGFFHITNLEFYRSKPVQNWADILIGEERFSRKFDDQVMVTIPAAVLAPERSRAMRKSGFDLQVMHNGCFDGDCKNQKFIPRNHGYTGKQTWYVPYFEIYGKEKFPEAYDMCLPLVKNNG